MNELLALLTSLGISYEMVTHDAIATIDEMQAISLPHQQDIVKNLFLRDDKKRHYYLVCVESDKRVDLKALSLAIPSRRLSFASESDLMRYLHLEKGEVTPMGIMHDERGDVRLIMDEDIKRHTLIGVHPFMNTAMVYLKVTDFENLMAHFHHEITYIKI